MQYYCMKMSFHYPIQQLWGINGVLKGSNLRCCANKGKESVKQHSEALIITPGK